jgi:hypothetical protein
VALPSTKLQLLVKLILYETLGWCLFVPTGAFPISWMNIVVHLDPRTKNNWISIFIEYQNGDGDLKEVELQQEKSNSWKMMQGSWGSN